MSESRGSMRLALTRCVALTAVAILLWGLLVGPAYIVAGWLGVEGVTIAAVLCTPPGWLVVYFSAFAKAAGAAAVMAGTVVRLFVVMAGALLVRSLRPELGTSQFLIWVVIFYLVILLVETWMVTRPGGRETGSSEEPTSGR